MPEPKTRRDYLDIADKALHQAARLAELATSGVAYSARRGETQAHAAAGVLWADVARSAAAIAAVLPDTTEETDRG